MDCVNKTVAVLAGYFSLQGEKGVAVRANVAGTFSAFVAALVLLMGSELAQAQNTTTTSSAFGTRSLGGSQQSSRTTGSNTSAASSMGQGGAMGQGQGTGAGTSSRTGTFVGGSQRTTRAVGNVQAGQAGGAGMNGQLGGFGQSMMNRNNQNRNGQNGFGQQNNNQQQAANKLRVPLRLGFVPTPVASSTFSTTSGTRMAKLPAMKNSKGVNVSLEGTTAVLRGEVASEADRQLAEGLLMLEPGVSEVRNELVIRSTPPLPEVLPALPRVNSARP